MKIMRADLAEQQVLRFLEAGERLLWAGRPGSGLRLRRADAFVIPFSLMWMGFMIFWEINAFRVTDSMFFRLWGVPFLVAGSYLVVGRFFWDAWRRVHTYYALTDRCILIVSGARSQTATTLPLRTLPAVTLAERPSGEGDIVLGASDGRHVAVGGLVAKGSHVPPMLEFLADARAVYDMIRRAQRSA